MSFFEDLKRRNVIRVAAAYAIVGWLIIQVVETVFSIFGIPDEFARIVVILVAIGFPFALIFSWVYEFTPDGLKLERDIDHSRSSTQHSGRMLDRTIIVVLALALGYFVIEKFIELDGDPSIAVLPFADMSPNGDQGYFGNGMADQLIDELVRLDDLRVAPFSSSRAFGGTNKSPSEIAEALDVETILKGSIRKDGDRLRITAQFINIEDGKILWSETFDRRFENIFEIQEEIATKVSGQLAVRFGIDEVNAYVGAGTLNVEAYELYLQILPRFDNDDGIRDLNRAIELDPNYAAAWSLLAKLTLTKGWGKYPGENRENEERAYALVLRALELAPESAQAIAQLGTLLQVRRDLIGAEDAYLKALSIRPDRPNLNQYASHLQRDGRSADALEQWEKSAAVKPTIVYSAFSVYSYMALGRIADARAVWAQVHPKNPIRMLDLDIALHEGDPEVIKAIMAAKPPAELATIKLYAPVLKEFDSREMVLSILRDAYADNDSKWPSKLTDIALLAAYFGDEELALQTMGEEARLGSPRFIAAWYPLMANVRQSQGFKELVTDLNMVAVWREKGWADLCRPLGADDFECR